MRVAVLVLGLVVLTTAATRADVAEDLTAIRAAVPACDPARVHCIGLQLHIAAGEHGLVATPDWVAEQVATANRHFAAIDVAFQVVGADVLPETAVHVVTRADRDKLAAGRLGGTVVQVFFIGKLEDVDDPGAIVWGVTWHTRKDDHKYVIVSGEAHARTLAHELGHVFGLPHSEYAISIMNKTKRAEPPMEQRTFAEPEVAELRRGLKRLLGDKILADLAP